MAHLRTSRTNVVEWPPLSPDLSPIENVWGEVKRAVGLRRPQTAKQLQRYSRAAWRRLTSDKGYVAALFNGMQQRMLEVKAARGGAIDR